MIKNLDRLSSEELGRLFPIILSEPNPDWFRYFQKEKKRILKIFDDGSISDIKHIGSTAIPNLKSKPTIDILVEIKDNINTEIFERKFNQLGYHLITQPDKPPPYMMFVKGYTTKGYNGQAYHIHLRYKGDWDEVYFRDYLISNPLIAKKYETLKEKLSVKYRYNREKYTDGKNDFIKSITSKARKKLNRN